jgi:ABC-type transport system involved in multi-copper enzyme maturation permease subunit
VRAVLERDFLFEASRPRVVVLRTVLAAAVAAIACLVLWQGLKESGVSRDTVGTVVFVGGSLTLLILLMLMTPPLVVGSILAERQNQTLPIVLATPVGPFAFAAAKLLSRWGVALLIAFAALPCLALTTILGGVSGTQVEGLAVTALALSLEMAAWSLWISSGSRRLGTAVVFSFLLPLARWMGTGFLQDWMERGDWSVAILAATCPTGAAMELTQAGRFYWLHGVSATAATSWPGRLILERPWWAYLAFAALLAAAAVAAAGSRLRTESEPRTSLLDRTKRRRRWFRGRPPAGNPVAWKEVRLLDSATSRPLFYGVLAILILVFLLGAKEVPDRSGILVLVSAMSALLSFVAAVSGAANFAHERTQGSYDLLRVSLLTPRQIAWGKLAGVFVGLGFLASVPVSMSLAGILCDSVTPLTLLAILVALVVGPGSWALCGAVLAILSPSPRAAVVRTCALFAILLVGLPLCGVVYSYLGHWRSDETAYLFMASPPAAAWGFLDCSRAENRLPGSEFDASSRAGLHWTAAAALIAIALYWALPRLLAWRLDRDRETG